MTSAQDAATAAAKLLLAVTTFESYKASIPRWSKERTAEQNKRYVQLQKAIHNAKSKRLKKGDEGYKESARSKSNAKSNAKNHAKNAVQAAARSEAARQARGGEVISTLTFVDACEQDAARCFQQAILPALQAGHGLDIMCMADHRLRPHRSSDAAADGASYDEPVVLKGLPYGGRTNDEATRWACLDSSPAIMSGFTMEPLRHEEFNLLFEVRLLRSHSHHEYTRLYEGELIRLCMRSHHGDIRHPCALPSPRPRRTSDRLIRRGRGGRQGGRHQGALRPAAPQF